MATLRPVEERDAKGNTIRMNPSVTYKQDPNIRVVIGRHDWRLDPNPNYHQPITAQVQEGKVLFFTGTPDTSATRALSREMSVKELPKYILNDLTKHPLRIREYRPTVYEVRIATIGDVEVTQTEEVPNDGQSVTVTPVAPNLDPTQRAGRAARGAEARASA